MLDNRNLLQLPKLVTVVFAFLCTLGKGLAQGTSCSNSVTTIRNSADATGLAACPTFTGNINIPADAGRDIALDGIRTLRGYLSADSADGLRSLSADSLETVEGYMYLERLANLESLNMSKLQTVGQLRLNDLPALSKLEFDATVDNCSNLFVSDTALLTLDGLDPKGTTNGFQVTNNKNLANITMSVASTMATVASNVTIADNSPALYVSLPNLEAAQNLVISNATQVSLPALKQAYTLNLMSNAFTEFSAPKLASVGNDTMGITIQSNQGLTMVDLPILARTGVLSVVDNTRLQNLVLGKLQLVPNGIMLEGNLANVSLPSLQDVGPFVLNTSSPILDCLPFQQYKDQNIITGSLDCVAPKQHSSSPPAQPSVATGPSTGAKIGIGAGVGAAGLLGLGLSVFVCCKCLRPRNVRHDERRRTSESSGKMDHTREALPLYEHIVQLPDTGASGIRGYSGKGEVMETSQMVGELDAPSQVLELPADREFVELAADGPGRA